MYKAPSEGVVGSKLWKSSGVRGVDGATNVLVDTDGRSLLGRSTLAEFIGPPSANVGKLNGDLGVAEAFLTPAYREFRL